VRAAEAAAVLAALLLAGCFVGDDDVPPPTPPVAVRAAVAPLAEGFHLTGSATGSEAVPFVDGCAWWSRIVDAKGVVVAEPGNATADCAGEGRTLQVNESVAFATVWDGRGLDGAKPRGNHTWELSFVDATGRVHGPARTRLALA
jgi:hypothetical protein